MFDKIKKYIICGCFFVRSIHLNISRFFSISSCVSIHKRTQIYLANILPVSVTMVIGLVSVSHVGVVVYGVINVKGLTAEKETTNL